ncbi:MAG: hypothetical protein HY898_09130 [Deltaproteobacteria bacterium]|nr:hypothetical protein [Deltaproteobacteria bacterium]
MNPSVPFTMLLVVSAALGCSSSDSSATPQAPAFGDPLAATCDEPAPPAPIGQASVVGDGTAGSCTAEALQAAVDKGGDVSFQCGADPITIAVTSEIKVSKDIILDGKGKVTLDGGGASRILSADQQVAVTLIGLTFTRGKATATEGGPVSGGAVRGGWKGSIKVFDCTFTDNEAGTSGEEGGGALYTPSRTTMTIVRSHFQGNRAGTGGAVHNLLSELTIVNSTFDDNESTTEGGGAVYTDGASGDINDSVGGTITLCGCRFTGNRGKNQGGAAYLFAYAPDKVVVNQCAFSSNRVTATGDGSALGGGLRVGNAPLDLANSLFESNHADTHGGGLWVDGKYPTRVNDSTFWKNDAGVVGKDAGYGGALSGANLHMSNLTLVDNQAVHSGGAIFNEDDQVVLANSIVARNTAGNQWKIGQSCRKRMQGSRNIQWPDPAANGKEDALCTAGVVIADPLLGDLSDQGGATRTMPIAAGSPAIDAGEGCSETDQRGKPRKGACDLGAFEAQ